MPGTMSAFAEAYQQMLGGSLTGQESISMFLKDMGDGKIKSSEIMPYAGKILSKRAESKVGIMKKSSMAEQERFANIKDDMTQKFGSAGGEEGYARFWWSLTRSIGESTEEMEFFGRAFDKVMYGFSKFVLLPQSIKRMFQGRDSAVRDWMDNLAGSDNVDKLLKTVKELGSSFAETFKIGKEGWSSLFSLAQENNIGGIYTAAAAELMSYLNLLLLSVQIAAEQDPVKKQQLLEKASGVATDTMAGTISQGAVEDTPDGKWAKGSRYAWQLPMLFFGGSEEFEKQANAAKSLYIQDGSFTNLGSANSLEKDFLAGHVSKKLKEKYGFTTNASFDDILEAMKSSGSSDFDFIVDYLSHSIPNVSGSEAGYQFKSGGGVNFKAFEKINQANKLRMIENSKAGLSKAYSGAGDLNYNEVLTKFWESNGGNAKLTLEALNSFIQSNYSGSLTRNVDELGNPIIQDNALNSVINGLSPSIKNDIKIDAPITIKLESSIDTEAGALELGEKISLHFKGLIESSMLPYANAV